MPYVMVPVPEEHVEDVMSLILRLNARAAQKDWDQDSVTSLYNDLDEDCRSLLSFVARGVINGKDLTVGDVASMIELNVRETNGIVRDINEAATEREHPNLVGHRNVTEVLPNGRTQEKRIMVIETELAALVQEAERADLLADPGPLAEG